MCMVSVTITIISGISMNFSFLALFLNLVSIAVTMFVLSLVAGRQLNLIENNLIIVAVLLILDLYVPIFSPKKSKK